jgi:hypothetical protein
MRTIKALACAAALAAGLATAVAQSNVYSLNVVGYYNVSLAENGFYMIANQLNTTNNTLNGVIPTAADGTLLYKWINGAWNTASYLGFLGAWDNGDWSFNPGEAALIQDPGGTGGQTFTFVGEVMQGPALTTTLNVNNQFTCFANMVPVAGTPTSFALPGEDGDTLYYWDTASKAFLSANYLGFLGDWDSTPDLAVGEGFLYYKNSGTVNSTWVQSFTVQ